MPRAGLEAARKKMTKCIGEFEMIEDGDRLLIAVSGGKDSAVMALLVREIQKRAPIDFSFSAVILDQKQPGFDLTRFEEWLSSEGIPLTVIEEDTYSIVREKTGPGKSYCGLCSRLRRGVLYNYADANGFDKIVLGHHRDDANETALLNLFFSGSICSMPPVLRSDDGRNTVIRPMLYIGEDELASISASLEIPVIPCNLCGSQENLRRQRIKGLLSDLEGEIPGIRSSLLSALGNVKPSQLMDRRIWDFGHSSREAARSVNPE